MTNILLFEPDSAKIPHLVFVLKLAGIDCTVSRTIDEMLNWLSAANQMVARFDLVLLNTFEKSHQQALAQRQPADLSQIPVIVVKRTQNNTADFPGVKPITCSPDNLLTCLQEQLSLINHISPARENAS
jgi:DNA-binding NtrC family response regulator